MPVPKKRKIEDSLGPYCDNLGIRKSKLQDGNFVHDSTNSTLSNGVVLEILKLWRQKRGDDTLLEKYFRCIFQDGSFHNLKSSALGLWSKRESMRVRKDRDGIAQLETSEFDISAYPYVPPPPPSPEQSQHVSTVPQAQLEDLEDAATTSRAPVSEAAKQSNFLQFQIAKQQKQLTSLKKSTQEQAEKRMQATEHYKEAVSEFKPHNVRRRDKRAAQNLASLFAAKKNIKELQKRVSTLEKQLQMKAAEPESKRKLQKRLSYFKSKDSKFEFAVCLDCEKRKDQVEALEAEISKRDSEPPEKMMVDFFQGGKISEKVRLAALELTALDVATGKICDVIEVVSKHIFDAECSRKPSRKAIQNIVDAGQFLAKTFINKEISESGGLGIAKDGTTRRKVKTQETNVLLSNGRHYSLGFSSLPSETGEAIKSDVETKLEELAAVAGDSNFKEQILRKLEFLISDRAANEKKSNKIIKEWSSVILQTTQPQHQVQEYFCMAHVLLAFHTYSLKELKNVADVLGMDFSGYKNPIEKFLKYASDIFGPVGDYRGVRDVWLEDCRQRNVKSIITNYKDNRFNGLFHVAGQIYHHHLDFIRILENHKNSNFRQSTVLTGLKNKKLILLFKCLGLFFYKITGPYWNAITSGNYSYPQMGPIVKDLRSVVITWEKDPAIILSPSVFCLPQLCIPNRELEGAPSPQDKHTFFQFVSVIGKGFINALDAQVSDLMTGEDPPSSCQFAPPTNLVCERGLGMLDASQRMRPNASLHHHSTVVALKQTRCGGMYPWLAHLSAPVRRLLWQKARKGGRELREQHRARDLATQRECHRLSQIPHRPQKQSQLLSRASAKIQALNLPSADEGISKDDWVAVAYPQTWYTGKFLDLKIFFMTI